MDSDMGLLIRTSEQKNTHMEGINKRHSLADGDELRRSRRFKKKGGEKVEQIRKL